MQPESAEVATAGTGVYLLAMVALRLLRFLTLFALILASFGMISAHAQMAMPVSASSGHEMGAAEHCAGMDQERKQKPASGINCTIACSAVPSATGAIAVHPKAAAEMPPIALATSLFGLHPESDPPPPRFA